MAKTLQERAALNKRCAKALAAMEREKPPAYLPYFTGTFAMLCHPSPERDQFFAQYKPEVGFALVYILRHLGQHALIQKVAAVLKIGTTGLKRQFIDHLRVTMIDYITHCRIEVMIALVRTANMGITDALAFIGWNKSPVLSLRFKKLMGFEMSQLRNFRLKLGGPKPRKRCSPRKAHSAK